MNHLGKRIRTLRKQKRMTQQELVGHRITRSQLSLIESGSANPSMATLTYIAERLGTTASQLMSDQAPGINEIEAFVVECEYHNQQSKHDINIDRILHFLDNYKQPIDINTQNSIGKLYALLGIAYYSIKNTGSEDALQKALLLLDKTVSPDYVARALNTIAKQEYYKEHYIEMKKYLLEANEVINEITLDIILLKLDIIYNLALASARLKQYDEAFIYIDTYLEKSKKYEISRNYGKLQMLLGDIHMRLKNYREAIDFDNRAIDYFSSFPDDVQKNLCMLNKGIKNRLIKDYNKSLEYFDTAYRFFENKNDEAEMLNIRAERLKTKFFMKIDSTNIIDESKQILPHHKLSKLNRFDLLIVLGTILLENAHYEAAKEILDEAECYCNKFIDTEFSIYLFQGLSKVYKQHGDFEKAYSYIEKVQ